MLQITTIFKEVTLLATKENKKKDFTVNNAIYIKGYKQIIGGISKWNLMG